MGYDAFHGGWCKHLIGNVASISWGIFFSVQKGFCESPFELQRQRPEKDKQKSALPPLEISAAARDYCRCLQQAWLNAVYRQKFAENWADDE